MLNYLILEISLKVRQIVPHLRLISPRDEI